MRGHERGRDWAHRAREGAEACLERGGEYLSLPAKRHLTPSAGLGTFDLRKIKYSTIGDKKSLHNYEYKYLPFLKRNEGRQGKSTKTEELQKVNPNELVIFSMVWREINKIM